MLLVGLIVLLCRPAFSQHQPPVIFSNSVPDPLKLPDNLFRIELIGLSALVAILRSKLVHGFERRPTT